MAKIGLIKPSDSDFVSLTDINSNWTKIENAIGELGTPSDSNNLLSITRNEQFTSCRAEAASSWANALAAVSTTTVGQTTRNSIASFLSAADELAQAQGAATVAISRVVVSGSTAGMAVICKSNATYYTILCLPLTSGVITYARRNGTSSYSVRFLI